MPDADAATDYIKVTLARPVPGTGQARLLILKTYKDPKSYYLDGKTLVFDRPLGVQAEQSGAASGLRGGGADGAVADPHRARRPGRDELFACRRGRAPLVIRAAADAPSGAAARPLPPTTQRSWESPFQGETEEERLAERAHQDREIVYFLQQPETHAFSLYHDYTESRPGMNGYANVVRRAASRAIRRR